MPSEEVSAALASGKAFADLSSWRKIDVSGPDALTWLSHIGSADVDDLSPGRARATVIRSERGAASGVTVALAGATVLVIQDPDQPEAVLGTLGQLVNSYDILLDDRSDALALFSFPGATNAPDVAGTAFATPSCVGAGVDVFALAEDHAYLLGSLQHGFMLTELDDVRDWLGARTEQ
jgi:glycine cleavage system aminomethyltransferase T